MISRGRVVVEDGRLHVERGSGVYLRRSGLTCRCATRRPFGSVLKALVGLEDAA